MNTEKVLSQAPAKIAELSEKAEDSRFIWKTCEIQQKQLEAKTHLETKAENPDLTQSDLKATVEAETLVYERRMECLTLESAYKKELINLEKWRDAFVSARKKASLEIEQMRNLNDSVKGGK